LQIDLLRDFDAAEATSRRMLTVVEKSDPCFQALAHHTLGDALRCRDAVDAAAQSYEAALRIWPEQLATERAESLLMLAVCRARTGAYLTAYRDAVQAATIAGADARGAVDLQAARSLLEAASFAIHGGHLPQARRALIHAHQILRRDFQESVEWAALAQVAWSLVNRIQPDPADPQPPAPGFTITLSRDVCGVEKMAPQAPTMMLGRLCAASGSPHRALAYFEGALAEAKTPILRLAIATFALDPALTTGQLVLSVRYALIVGLWQQSEFAANAQPGFDAFILDHHIGRVIQLAVSRCLAPGALGDLSEAIHEIELSDNRELPAGCVLAGRS
jgi:tetratricopeptide (TPR) repeat protein